VIHCSAADYSDLSRRSSFDVQRRRWSSSFQEVDVQSDGDFVADKNANTSTCPEDNNTTATISTYSDCGLLKQTDSEIGILQRVDTNGGRWRPRHMKSGTCLESTFCRSAFTPQLCGLDSRQ
jgi:hypothetical protein